MSDNEITPRSCFDEIEPCLRPIARLIADSPLPRKSRGGLALLVATHFIGIASAETGDSVHELVDLLAQTLENEGPT